MKITVLGTFVAENEAHHFENITTLASLRVAMLQQSDNQAFISILASSYPISSVRDQFRVVFNFMKSHPNVVKTVIHYLGITTSGFNWSDVDKVAKSLKAVSPKVDEDLTYESQLYSSCLALYRISIYTRTLKHSSL